MHVGVGSARLLTFKTLLVFCCRGFEFCRDRDRDGQTYTQTVLNFRDSQGFISHSLNAFLCHAPKPVVGLNFVETLRDRKIDRHTYKLS